MYRFSSLKQTILREIAQIYEDLIDQYYPKEWRDKDPQRKEYHGSALMLMNPEYTTDFIYRKVSELAQAIFSGQIDLQEAVSQFPKEEQIHWEMLIKIAIRTIWLQRTRYMEANLKNSVLNANSLNELLAIKNSSIPYAPLVPGIVPPSEVEEI